MTRKTALRKALEVVTDKEVANKLQEIMNDLPLTSWSENTIFDSLEQWIEDNGRTPTTTDLKQKGLPPHTVIKQKFNMTAKEFLTKYYKKPCNPKPYRKKRTYKVKKKPTKLNVISYNNLEIQLSQINQDILNNYGTNFSTYEEYLKSLYNFAKDASHLKA